MKARENNNNNNNNQNEIWSEIKFFNSDKTITVFDWPPNLGGEKFVISKKRFAKAVGMQAWSESIILKSKSKKEAAQKETEIAEIAMQLKYSTIINEIKENYKKLGIGFTGSAGDAVFALEDLPENAYIMFGSGEFSLTQDKVNKFSEYSIEMDNFSIDGEKYGGMSSFLQHLPEKKSTAPNTISLDNFQFNEEAILETVATANLHIIAVNILNKYCCILFKTREAPTDAKKLPDGRNVAIEKGQILGWSYPLNYWIDHNIVPELFDKNGATIDPKNYAIQNIVLIGKYKDLDGMIQVMIPKKEIAEKIKTGPYVVYDRQNNIGYGIIRNDFEKALQKYSNSLFIIFDHPSFVVRPPQVKPQTSLTLGFLQDLNKIVCDQLARITKFSWRVEKGDFCLQAEVNNLEEIEKYFLDNGVAAQICFFPTKKLFVFDPDLPLLEKMKEMNVRNDFTLPPPG